jgi:sterol desaturase/sphingolipid hydroxylase (fatty acid hydroxylase superfamily)
MEPNMIVGLGALVLLFALEGMIPFYRGRRDRLQHGFRNMELAVVAGVAGALMAPLTVLAIALAERQGIGLCNVLDAQPVVCASVAFVLFDLWMYAWHRANHEIPLLWRFHQVHHTDPAMDSTTALRFHPGELIISSLLNCVVLVLIGMSLDQLVLYKTVMISVVLFHHSNVRLASGLDRAMRSIVVPPSMHRIHHSHLQEETDSSYGTVFSFWDRLFGSYRTRASYGDIRFGTGVNDGPEWQTLPRLMMLPFRPLRAAAAEGGTHEASR